MLVKLQPEEISQKEDLGKGKRPDGLVVTAVGSVFVDFEAHLKVEKGSL